MRRVRRLIVWSFLSAIVGTGVAHSQGRGGASWSTTAGDAQRTSSVRTDPKISVESMQKPGFRLLWKDRLDNQAKQLNSLTQPLLLPNIISYKGFKALAFVGGSSDTVYSIDYDLNRMFWTRKLSTSSSAPGSLACPGGLTALTRATPAAQAGGGRGGAGRGGPAGGAGAPAAPGSAPQAPPNPPAGAVVPGAPPTAPVAGAPAALGTAGAGRGAGGGGGRGSGDNVYAISSGGMVHTLNPQTGDDMSPPITFLPPNAKVAGPILVNNVLYAATADDCGGAPNGVWAVDLASDPKVPVFWETKGGGVVGTAGAALGADATLYAATGDGVYSESTYSNAVVSLEPKTLTLKDWFTPGKTPFTGTPVVFQYKGKDLIVAANKDGRLYLLDSAALGGSDHKTPLSKTAPYASGFADFSAGAVSSWAETDGTRWVLVASGGPVHADSTFPTTNGTVTTGSIVAFKVVDQNGAPALQPAWVSRDMTSPLPPAIVNGVVFAIASGEYRTTDARMTAAQRAQRSKPAVLYALDAASGKALWNSGTAIASFAHGSGPSAGDSQVYVVTYDSTVYAFGMPAER